MKKHTSCLVLVAILVAGFMNGLSTDVKARSCGGFGWRERVGPWTRVQAPMAIQSFTVDPYQPSVMFVANDVAVMRSVNTGCSWDQAFRADSDRRIVDVVMAPSGKDAPLYALLSAPPIAPYSYGTSFGSYARPVPGPAIAVSRDHGKTWKEFSEGLPDIGRPTMMTISPSQPQFVYMMVSLGQHVVVGEAGQEASVERTAFYASRNGGKTWTVAADPMFEQPAGVFGMVVDPLSHRSVWAATSAGLAHSNDGGKTWATIEKVGPEKVDAVSVAHSQGRDPRVVTFRGGSMFLSQDGGKSWKKYPASDFYQVRAAGHVPGSETPIVSAETQMFLFDMGTKAWKDVTPRLKAERNPGQDNYYCRFSATSAKTDPALYTCTSTTLLKFSGRG